MIRTDWSLLQLQLWFSAPNSDQSTALLKIVCFPACLIVIYLYCWYYLYQLLFVSQLVSLSADEIVVGWRSKGASTYNEVLLVKLKLVQSEW